MEGMGEGNRGRRGEGGDWGGRNDEVVGPRLISRGRARASHYHCHQLLLLLLSIPFHFTNKSRSNRVRFKCLSRLPPEGMAVRAAWPPGIVALIRLVPPTMYID